MGSFEMPARQLIFAGGLVLAVLAAPMAAFAGPAPHSAPRNVAQTECGEGLTMDPGTLECVPEVAPGGTVLGGPQVAGGPEVAAPGAPSEGQLTEDNPGVASPSHAH